MSGRPVEVLLHHMPGVISAAENELAVAFAKSILRQSKRPGWEPSPKQLHLMNRLVAELFAHREIDVIEDFEQ